MISQNRPKIVVLGSINMDLVIRCAELPCAGQTTLAESSAEYCGGKGANQAVAAALAGGQVSMIGAVGTDAFAERLVGNLKQHAIDCQRVSHRDELNSGLAVISVDQRGQNSIMVVPGANASVSPDEVLAATPLVESADALLVQLEIPLDSVTTGIEIARRSGVRILLDPAPAPKQYSAELLAVDLLCPNESEAAELTGISVDTVDDATLAAAKLIQMGARHVAVTLGGRGTLLHSDGQSQLIPAFETNVIDTTAAGDAFAGALAVHWSRTNDLCKAVRFANAAGSLAASKAGAQVSMATEREIELLGRTH